MDNIDDPWNFHTCKLCNYRTSFLGRILSHVRQHRTRAATHRFICNLHPPEEHKCEKCQLQSHLKVLLTNHFNTVHKAKETQHYLNSELLNCESCGFQTYSSLVLLGHNCDNGVRSENHILQASQTGSGQRENCQSYILKHPPNKKSCAISAQISPNDVDSDDMTTDNMKHKRILSNSNIQLIQHPSNKKTCTISSQSNSNDIDSDDMPIDSMKRKRILRSSIKSKVSNIQYIQHLSNKNTCTMSSQSAPNDIGSGAMTTDNMKHTRILRSSKKPKLSNNQHIQHSSNKKTCTVCSENSANVADSNDMTTDNMKHKLILHNSKKSKLSNIQDIQHPSNMMMNCIISLESIPIDIDSDNMAKDTTKHERILRSSKRPKLSNIPHIIQHQSNEKACTICSQSSSNDVYSGDMTPDKMKHTRLLRNLRKHKHSNVRHIQHPTNKTASTVYDLRSYQTLKEKDLRKNILQAHNPSKNISWFKCEDCSNKYNNKTSLRRHVLTHHTHVDKKKVRRVDREKVRCDYCSYKLNKDYLTEHIYRRHAPSEQINWCKCEYCSHKTKVKKDLEQHVLIKHTQFVEPQKLKLLKHCDKCTYKTLKNRELKVHVFRKHTPAICIT